MDKTMLVECIACGGKVGENAKSCPHCGEQKETNSIMKWVLYIIGVVLILWGASILYQVAEIAGYNERIGKLVPSLYKSGGGILQQIMAGIMIIIGAISFSSGAIVSAISKK